MGEPNLIDAFQLPGKFSSRQITHHNIRLGIYIGYYRMRNKGLSVVNLR